MVVPSTQGTPETVEKDQHNLGIIPVEMKAILRTPLEMFLKIQNGLKTIMAIAILALLLTACTTGTTYNHQGVPSATPYDSKYKRVLDYLETAYRFRYEADTRGIDHWQLPEETERRGKGDCEDKAIWLYSKLLHDGFDNVRLVIGKRRKDSATFHVWVAWYEQGEVYILDPTNEGRVREVKHYPRGYYQPYYSFCREKSWIHFGEFHKSTPSPSDGQTLVFEKPGP